MGLDMYLYKKTYVEKWDHQKPDEQYSVLVKRGNKSIPKEEIDTDKVVYIIEQSGYWRKANAIHDWFVRNVQNGVDDCKNYYVSSEQLQTLLGTVNEVLGSTKLVDGFITNGYRIEKDGRKKPIAQRGKILADPSVAKKLLPTAEGFFFGSIDYDENYWADLLMTKEILEEALKNEEADYEYSSSW